VSIIFEMTHVKFLIEFGIPWIW